MATTRTFDAAAQTPTVKSNVRTVLLTSAALGTAAFLSDLVPGTLGVILLTLTSSGLAWGITALIMGFRQTAWRAAILGSTATLLIATVVYYSMILGLSQRWRGGTLQDGSSADLNSLLSVSRAAAFWAIASVCAGLVLGTIGWKIRIGSERQSAILTGAAFGLFAANGFEIMVAIPWVRLQEYLHDVGFDFMLSGALTIGVSALAAFFLLREQKSKSAMVTFTISAVVSVILGVLLWKLVDLMRVLVSV